MQYLKITNGTRSLSVHPGWYKDSGELVDDDLLAEHGYYLVIDNPPVYDAGTQTIEVDPIDNWEVIDGKAYPSYTVATIPPPTIAKLISYAVNKRWEKEIGGITLSGMPIATDDRSKTMIIGARIKADLDPTFTTKWGSSDGTYTMIDAATIIAISDAILDHVDYCFETWSQVVDNINNGSITTFAEIDTAFFPGV